MSRFSFVKLWVWMRRPWVESDAQPAPAPRWLVAASYIGFPLLSFAIALFALRITTVAAITQAPILTYDEGDTLLILPMVKDASEHGTHWHNDRMGAPDGFQLYDFPVIDHLHFACIWVLGQVTGSYVTTFNLYFLLGFPLATLTTLFVFRRFGFSLPASGAAGLMYAFLAYHAGRGQSHYFLSAYWVIPLSMLLVLRIANGEPPFTESRDGQLRWSVLRFRSLGAIVIAVMTALAGAYYAFFTCALLGFAGVYGSLAARSWKPLLVTAIVVGVVTAGGVAAHAPMKPYHAVHGKNGRPIERLPQEAEIHGLKIASMLLPQPTHQCEWLGRTAGSYFKVDWPLQSENNVAGLGIIGSFGLLAAGVTLLLPGARRWPFGPLGALIVFAILFTTIGGLGTILNFFVTPQVRAYTRISIFIAFFAFFAAFWILDRWLPKQPIVRWVLFLLLGLVGIADQMPRPWFRPQIAEQRQRNVDQYASDAEFYAKVEEAIPGCAVYCLPHITYPESPPRILMAGNRFATGYLHTRTVRWSFGAMRGRELDEWMNKVAAEPVPVMAQHLIERGFDAICLDTIGYPEAEGKQFIADLTKLCGPPIAQQPGGSRYLFDLRSLKKSR